MTKTVFTNYWVNRRVDVKREHGSYETEEEAVEAIQAWWEIHRKSYSNVTQERTNTGALEIEYGDPNYVYRVEKRIIEEPLPSKSYRLKTQGEIDSLRQKHQLDEETVVFDELPEPYRDRLVLAMGDPKLARKYTYTKSGQPIVEL